MRLSCRYDGTAWVAGLHSTVLWASCWHVSPSTPTGVKKNRTYYTVHRGHVLYWSQHRATDAVPVSAAASGCGGGNVPRLHVREEPAPQDEPALPRTRTEGITSHHLTSRPSKGLSLVFVAPSARHGERRTENASWGLAQHQISLLSAPPAPLHPSYCTLHPSPRSRPKNPNPRTTATTEVNPPRARRASRPSPFRRGAFQ